MLHDTSAASHQVIVFDYWRESCSLMYFGMTTPLNSAPFRRRSGRSQPRLGLGLGLAMGPRLDLALGIACDSDRQASNVAQNRPKARGSSVDRCQWQCQISTKLPGVNCVEPGVTCSKRKHADPVCQ